MRELSSLLALIFGFGLTACGGPRGSVTPASPASNSIADGESIATDSAPVPAPRPSITGCVESRELKAYVLALEAHRRSARREALEALGAIEEERSGRLGAAGSPDRLGSTFEANGQRFAIAAQRALGSFSAAGAPTRSEARTTLAKRAAREGALLRPIAERPRAHAVSVLSCGVQRCASKAAERVTAPVRPLIIELGPSETWGAPLELAYDYWWAKVRYDRAEPCGASAAASATP